MLGGAAHAKRRAFERPFQSAQDLAADAFARGRMHQRRDPARTEKAVRMPGVWRALHPRASDRRSDGLKRGRLRRLFPLSPPGALRLRGVTLGQAFGGGGEAASVLPQPASIQSQMPSTAETTIAAMLHRMPK